MSGSDLIVAVPWIAFGIALLVLCLQLRRSCRASAQGPRSPAAPAQHHASRQADPAGGREDTRRTGGTMSGDGRGDAVARQAPDR